MKKNITTEAKEGRPTKKTRREVGKLALQEKLTIGVDIGDRTSHYCVLDAKGDVVEEGKLGTTKTGLNALFEGLAAVRVAIETGTHSPWISRQLSSQGHEVIVANPRQVKAISESSRKNDRVDALKLAKLARFDPELLSPIQHRKEETQLDLLHIRSRENLVQTRTALINEARGQVKALGYRLESCDADKMGREQAKELPEGVRAALALTLETIEQLTEKIKQADWNIGEIAKKYPEIELLTAIYGVGELTALAFVLTIEDAGRFDKSREVGAYLGMVPGQRQSGGSDPEQRITKEGDRMVRWMLVQCAHCILRKNAPDSDLKRWGEKKLIEQGGKPGKKSSKKKVLVAMARKLSVVMHKLWANGEVYDPQYNAKQQARTQEQPAA
ncbi:MAG: IS110 family transposase [Usitatibacteraceae bacterium]